MTMTKNFKILGLVDKDLNSVVEIEDIKLWKGSKRS